MKTVKEKISLTLDDDVIAKLKILAKDDDRSLSQCVNKILRNHIENLPQKSEHHYDL